MTNLQRLGMYTVATCFHIEGTATYALAKVVVWVFPPGTILGVALSPVIYWLLMTIADRTEARSRILREWIDIIQNDQDEEAN